MSETELPEWCQVGRQVAVLSRGVGRSTIFQAKLDTIERIGKRDIVLTGGERFNRNKQYNDRFAKYGDTWSPTTYLCSQNDKDVVEAFTIERRKRLQREAEVRLKSWVTSGDEMELEILIGALKHELEQSG